VSYPEREGTKQFERLPRRWRLGRALELTRIQLANASMDPGEMTPDGAQADQPNKLSPTVTNSHQSAAAPTAMTGVQSLC
jgi:hypothetical protein